ncbi:MAG: FAD-dependent oxidoreductase [Bilophila wadsworthia]
MSTTEQDIIIVGGGISGAALAYGAFRQGRKVTVWTRRPIPIRRRGPT